MNDCSFIANHRILTYIGSLVTANAASDLHCRGNELNRAAIRKRTAPKEERQQQLIQATIRSVARNGLSDTTMATVSREAGLSQGIINLHFQSKDRLLVETLRYLSEQYRNAWEKAVDNAGDSPADKLAAMVAIDFKAPVCDRNKLDGAGLPGTG
jgi:TetR/AcrR family transcriptional repressor of bet genes